MRAWCQIPELLQAGARIVDMRSPNEIAAGHASRSLNIPLSDLPQRVIELNG